MIRATVVIPSNSHGPLLELSAGSVLAQTVNDLELFIVLDGADQDTRAAALAVAATDQRVRVFDNPKGEGFGEVHRDAALAETSGKIVAYLGDDDLWFPDHLEYAEELLRDAEFAHTLVVNIEPDGAMSARAIDLAYPFHRRGLFANDGFSLSAGAHTLEAYRRLEVGWSPAPPEVSSDMHMWRKFARDPAIRMVSGGRPTALHFGSPARAGKSLTERYGELAGWAEVVHDPGRREAFRLDVFEYLNRRRAFHLREVAVVEAEKASLSRELAESMPADEAEKLKRILRTTRRQLRRHQRQLDRIRNSVAHRATRRVSTMPVIGSVVRGLGRLLLRGEGRHRIG